MVALLFYRSPLGFITGLLIIPFWIIQYKDSKEIKRRAKLKVEFKEYMTLIGNSLQAGYSLEKAFKQSEEELYKLFGKESVILRPIHEMNQKVGMNLQIEKAFEEFAKNIELEEAMSLSDILSFAKRSGGDYGKQIRNCAIKIEEKLAVNEEIETLTAEKQLELKVMCVMPLGILAYISLTSKEFIMPLYGNMIGVSVMTVCLLIYGAMIVLGKKIVNIDV